VDTIILLEQWSRQRIRFFGSKAPGREKFLGRTTYMPALNVSYPGRDNKRL
jgi:hypothetical protein